MKNMRVVVFDADGMLILGDRFSERYSREFGVPVDVLLKFLSGDFKRCTVGKADLKAELLKHLNEWKWNGFLDELLRYWFEGNYLNAEMVPVVAELRKRGVRCVLATNQEKHRLSFLRNDIGLARVLDGVVASCEVGHKKPDREFLEALFERVQPAERSEVQYWDDRPENIQAARDFGFSAELYVGMEDFIAKTKPLLS